jgi:hypothetical protein
LNLSVFLALVALAAAFIAIEQPLLAGVCAIGALAIAFVKTGGGAAKAAKGTGKALAQGVGEDIEKAEGLSPDRGILVEGVKNAGEITGSQMFEPDRKKWKYKGHEASVSAAERLMSYFNKIFK